MEASSHASCHYNAAVFGDVARHFASGRLCTGFAPLLAPPAHTLEASALRQARSESFIGLHSRVTWLRTCSFIIMAKTDVSRPAPRSHSRHRIHERERSHIRIVSSDVDSLRPRPQHVAILSCPSLLLFAAPALSLQRVSGLHPVRRRVCVCAIGPVKPNFISVAIERMTHA